MQPSRDAFLGVHNHMTATFAVGLSDQASQPARTGPIRVLIVDDHPFLRDGVTAMISLQPDLKVIGEASTGEEAIVMFRELHPDVTLMDLQLAGMTGVETILRIRLEFPAARILVVTTFGGDGQILRALRAGCAGYLLKTAVRNELFDAIRTVHAGRQHLEKTVSNEIACHAGSLPLSDREMTVLALVADGQSNKQIAKDLRLSDETIKAHLKNIFLKLEVTDRTRAVTVAIRRGLIPW